MKNGDEKAKAALLAEINKDIPQGVDWKKGAETYVKQSLDAVGDARKGLEAYIYSKPMSLLTPDPEHAVHALEESIQYLYNFVNTIKLLNLPGGSTILDVACGGGWMSHYLRKFGYKTFGFDISEDFVAYARTRIRRDPDLMHLSDDEISASFAVHDIEAAPLPTTHSHRYDSIILESCLHHFVDPISALSNLAAALKPDGIIVIIEGENRHGEIRKEYMDVMRQFDTLERPYFRDHLYKALELAGLPAFETVGQVNGFYSPNDPMFGDQTKMLQLVADGKNLTVCAKSHKALARVLPFVKEKEYPSAEGRLATRDVI